MNRIAQFEKVSFEQFLKDSEGYVPGYYTYDEIKEVYNNIKLPKRASKGSAGYDIYIPQGLYLQSGDSIKIPTGIKCQIDEGWVLILSPRSSLGFKYRMQFDNIFPVIDQDYYNNKNNEGHIFCKITNDSRHNKTINLKTGDAFAQGLFLIYGITKDDNADGIRIGGIGSTNG